ncbi:MAG TPA: ABC transporter ATP-binding protein [Polyangiaceae bacterium]
MIEITHVSKFFGKIPALSDVSLSIEEGQRVALVGANGSGKTTLLRALLGLVRVSGRITVGGHDVAVSPERALRDVAYIPQIAPPLDAPVREVVRAVACLRNYDPARVQRYAAELGLDLEEHAGSRFRDLSGGMKQKVLAALALAAETRVLLCDEPTASLDASARAAFASVLERLPAERTVILCSHRAEELSDLVARTVELRDGRVFRSELTPSSSERSLVSCRSIAEPSPLQVAS